MKHLKNISEFSKLHEQLFYKGVKKFNKEIFGKDDDSQSSSSSTNNSQSTQSTGSNSKAEVKVVKTETPPATAKDLGSYGKFSKGKNSNSPLVVVYGGTNVGGRKSGVYMYDYFGPIADNYDLFVAESHDVNGEASYKALMDKVGSSTGKKILYLFSGGWRPGMAVLKKWGAKEFDKIYLVDIWMGNSSAGNFYVDLAKQNPNKVEYYYTSFGANNNTAKTGISGAVKVHKAQDKNDHMATNEDAIASLIKFA